MKDIMSLLISEVDIDHLDIPFEELICDRTVSLMGMLPCPVTRTIFSLCNLSVRICLAVNKSNISVVCLGLLVDKREYTLCTGAGHNDCIDLHCKLIDVTRELSGHVKERNQNGYIEYQTRDRKARSLEQDQEASYDSKNNVDDITDVAYDRSKYVRVCVSSPGILEQAVIDLIEFINGLGLVVKYLNDLLAVDHLLNITLSLTDSLLLLNEVLGRTSADDLRQIEHQDDTCHKNERHPYTVIQHKGKDTYYDGSAAQERRESLRYELS